MYPVLRLEKHILHTIALYPCTLSALSMPPGDNSNLALTPSIGMLFLQPLSCNAVLHILPADPASSVA
jgi:hypothetical protein